MKLNFQGEINEYKAGLSEICPMLGITLCSEGMPVKVSKGKDIAVWAQAGKGRIRCFGKSAFFRAIGLFCENLAEKNTFELHETPVFRNLAASFDMSRNGVLTVKTMKNILCKMALMGYTQAMMYTEDTYPVAGQPFFGYLRGRYSEAELKELDQYAYDLGIELVPCIQTLGHMERFLHWNSSSEYRDTADVLLAGNEKTYQLIEKMFASARACYKTDKIHVGMDEAMNLGLGGYLRDNGYEDGFSIMRRHIDRVCKIAAKYGFHPMMWSDMYFRCASKTHDYYEEDISIPEQVICAAPADMDLVYWDYYHSDPTFYNHYIKLHQQFSCNLWFAGGMWTWLGPAIDYDVFYKTSLPALESCKKNGVRDIMITTWGDDGAETNVSAMELGLQVYAEYCYEGTYDKEKTAERFRFCTGGNAFALERIAAFNKTERLDAESDLPNAAKFLLYQDPLLGLYDLDIENLGFAAQYEKLEQEFNGYAKTEPEYRNLYRFYAALAGVLKEKAELGIRLYRAYENKDMQTLAELSQQALRAADACLPLKNAWKEMWFATNKANGFEVLDARIGAVQARLCSCAQRVKEYCEGEISQIEELEEERLYILRKQNTDILNGVYFWRDIVSASKAY